MTSLVDIFASCNIGDYASVKEQNNYFDHWIEA